MKKNKKSFIFVAAISCLLAILLIHRIKSRACTSDKCGYDNKESGSLDSKVIKANAPTKELLTLLNVLDIKHDATLKNIIEVTQKLFLRPVDKERWEAEDLFPEKRDDVFHAAQKLGMIEERTPHMKHYTYAFLLGATAQTVIKRMAYLSELYKKGVRFDQVIIVTGFRMLAEDERNQLSGLLSQASKKPMTEADMMCSLYAAMPLPSGMEKLPIIFVNAKQKEGAKRATTSDTIDAWVSSAPLPGTILAISSQPFVDYQHAVLKTALPSEFVVETVGPQDEERTTTSILLDTVARWLYQEALYAGLNHA